MKKCWMALLLPLLFESPLQAGVIFEIERKDHEESPPRVETTQVSVEGCNLKMQIAGGGRSSQGTMVYRGARREMLFIDHDNKSYFVMNQEAIKAMASQIDQARKQMEERLKNVPADKRALVEQMMKRRMPSQQVPERPPTEVKKTGGVEAHQGYPCVEYEVSREGRKIRELWVTDWSNIEGGSEVGPVFEEMADFFKELMESFPSSGIASASSLNRLGENAFEHMKELNGFPVASRDFEKDGSIENESTLRSAKRQALSPAAFEPPAGYKRQQMTRRR